MRLIDGDELLASLPTCYQDLDDGVLIQKVWKTIQDAETVDAIPIEWLEKKYKDLEYSYSFGATDELKSRMDGIRYAINLWRKENETHK